MLRGHKLENGAPLDMDHCHSTDEFRYIFCHRCNTRASVTKPAFCMHNFENFDCVPLMDGISRYAAEAKEKYREEDEADAEKRKMR